MLLASLRSQVNPENKVDFPSVSPERQVQPACYGGGMMTDYAYPVTEPLPTLHSPVCYCTSSRSTSWAELHLRADSFVHLDGSCSILIVCVYEILTVAAARLAVLGRSVSNLKQ